MNAEAANGSVWRDQWSKFGKENLNRMKKIDKEIIK